MAEEQKRKRRIGIVGFGKLGQFLYQKVVEEESSSQFEVVFVWNRSRDKLLDIPSHLILEDLSQVFFSSSSFFSSSYFLFLFFLLFFFFGQNILFSFFFFCNSIILLFSSLLSLSSPHFFFISHIKYISLQQKLQI